MSVNVGLNGSIVFNDYRFAHEANEQLTNFVVFFSFLFILFFKKNQNDELLLESGGVLCVCVANMCNVCTFSVCPL